jgi:RNA polymerase sigma factor (sigma-70 family)
MTAEALFDRHAGRITSRLERMVGSREAAEDLTQEAFLRLWRQAPPGLSAEQGTAWLYRTARNLAVDELRRRRLRDSEELRDSEIAALAGDESEALAVREALARLTPHQRLLVLLRFQAGLSHREIGELLEISEEAARKRVSRARRAFAAAYQGTLPRAAPLILVETRDDREPYRAWLERAGAEVRFIRPGSIESQVAVADGFVLGGSVIDVHPALYRERPRRRLTAPDLSRDVRELRIMRAALEAGLPMVGVCKGQQLLNIALGGSLYQDIGEDGATRMPHWRTQHRIATGPDTHIRRILGRSATVSSEHHQAAREIGRGLRPTAVSQDSLVEALELPGERLVLGLQWHPEHPESGADGDRIAEALTAVAAGRAGEGPIDGVRDRD